MSASRDQSQKIAFVYSNLYKVYQKGKSAAQDAPEVPMSPPVLSEGPTDIPTAGILPAHVLAESVIALAKKSSKPNSNILKAEDLHSAEKSSVQVSDYRPSEFIGKRVARPASIPAVSSAPKEAISSLKDNLKALNDLHARLRFMLQELEDLVKD